MYMPPAPHALPHPEEAPPLNQTSPSGISPQTSLIADKLTARISLVSRRCSPTSDSSSSTSSATTTEPMTEEREGGLGWVWVDGWVGGGGDAEIICKRQAAAQMSRRGSSTLVALGTLALLRWR